MENTQTISQASALVGLCNTLIELVSTHGANGMPAGHLYAELMAYGCSLERFESIMAVIVSSGRLTKRGHVYFAA
jgi:hypothetical protein